MSLDRLQTLEQAADTLQLAPATLRRWVRKGRIRAHVLSTAQWCDVLDFTALQPAAYFCAGEVLEDASRSTARQAARQTSMLSELLEPMALIRRLSR